MIVYYDAGSGGGGGGDGGGGGEGTAGEGAEFPVACKDKVLIGLLPVFTEYKSEWN